MLRLSIMMATLFLASITGINQEGSDAPAGWNVAAAQDEKPGLTAEGKAGREKGGGNGKEAVETQTSAEPAGEEISDAERLLLLDRSIKADQAEVEELKGQLKGRVKVYKAAAERMEILKARRDEKEKALRKAEAEGTAEEAAGLKAEIEAIEEEYSLVKGRFDLAFEGHRTTLEQIRALEEKVERDRLAFERLVGRETPERKEVPGVSQEPAAPAGKPRLSAPPFVPGVNPSGREPSAAAKGEKAPEMPATTEQIEAMRVAEDKEEAARRAEEEVVEYVERKQALEEQIKLEAQLLNTAEEDLSNLEPLLEKRQKRKEEKTAAGAPVSEIRRIQAETREMEGELQALRVDIGKRQKSLQTLKEQLRRMEEEQQAAIREAERRREEAHEARRKSVWLQSPLYPKNVQRWAVTRGPRMLLILAAVLVILFVARFILKRTARLIVWQGRGEIEQREKRAATLAATLTGAATAVIVIGGLLIFLEEAGVNVATLLGGAAVIGLAVAFGAQNLMRDFFNGFMILMEGQYELNDLVTIEDVTGVVERMSMRMTMLRDLEGRAHFIPNGQIKRVTNRTHGWAQAVFDIGVAYQEDVDRVMKILSDLADEFRRDPDFGDFVLDEPKMLGVDDIGNSAFRVKFVMKTRPDKMWPVRREMLRRIKNRFDEQGIRIPVPHHVVFQQQGEDRETGPGD